jgi:Rieske 2Fe-2S family protein
MSSTGYRHTLPARYFYDPQRFQDELREIWRQEWLCVGRDEDWPQTGDFRRLDLAGQQIFITRDKGGALHAFFNSCRHRGAALCEATAGRFSNGRIVCPYHAWSYGLDGSFLQAPRSTAEDGLDPADFGLYRVALQTWRGFVFVNLADQPRQSLEQAVAGEGDRLAAWPLEDLRRVHRSTHRLACNWKVFWENYLECYHCPGVHPDLCRLVPLYRTGYTAYADAGVQPDPERPAAMLRPGAATWSADGNALLPPFKGLGDADAQRGMTFADFMPSMFLVAHVDYVRSVGLLAIGPEETELTVDWYVHGDLLEHPDLDVPRLIAFGSQVVAEDARVCELNQQGLRCERHQRGVLLRLEDHVYEFEQWVRERMGDGRS